MLDPPSPPCAPQHEGAAAQIVIADVEGDDGDVVERLDVHVLGVEPYPGRARGPNACEDLREGFADGLLADEPLGLMSYREERRRVVGEEAHHIVELER